MVITSNAICRLHAYDLCTVSTVLITLSRYGDKTPKGPAARLLAVVWIMISTVFLSLFTANASSILAISQAEEDVSNTLGKKVYAVC